MRSTRRALIGAGLAGGTAYLTGGDGASQAPAMQVSGAAVGAGIVTSPEEVDAAVAAVAKLAS